MKTYETLYRDGMKILEAAGVPEASLDALLLLESVCQTSRNDLYAHGDREISCELTDRYQLLIEKRSNRVPLQQLLGSQGFMGLDFDVNEHVLIPRQDTECLVEEALIYTMDGDAVLDMCTGSGCVLLSIMKYKNDIDGIGTDISKEALAVAGHNADKFGLNAEFIESDLFENVPKRQFDMIVSNPPYIRPDVIATLEPEVREHEPMIALDGGKDGLDYYSQITETAPSYLKKGGYLLYEIGFDQGEAVKDIMMKNGFRDVQIVKDLAGLDRVVRGYL